MKIAIVTRAPDVYSPQRLCEVAKARGHDALIVPIVDASLALSGTESTIEGEGMALQDVEAVIPRVTTFHTVQGFSLLQHFELAGCHFLNAAPAIEISRQKFLTLALLASRGIPIPNTTLTKNAARAEWAIGRVGGAPVVVKPVLGSQGDGIVRADTLEGARCLIEAMLKLGEDVLVQEYVAEAAGRDIRVLVVGGEVIAAIRRQAPPGRFRANAHQGGTSSALEPSPEVADLALRAVEAVGLDVAGVDILESSRGPLVIEINASPGLEVMDEAAGTDVAVHLVEYLEKKAGITAG